MVESTVPGMAEAIDKRMRMRRLTPTAFVGLAGLTEPGLAPVRKGVRRRYAAKTILGVAAALRWPVDWYDRLVAGEDWRTFPDTDHADSPLSDRARITALEIEMRRVQEALGEVTAALQLLVDRPPPTDPPSDPQGR